METKVTTFEGNGRDDFLQDYTSDFTNRRDYNIVLGHVFFSSMLRTGERKYFIFV